MCKITAELTEPTTASNLIHSLLNLNAVFPEKLVLQKISLKIKEMQKLYTVLWLQSCVLKIKLLKAEKVIYAKLHMRVI
jgi:hypothetical protein